MKDKKQLDIMGEPVSEDEMLQEMSKPVKEEEVVIIKGEEIPKRIYDLCILHYLSQQYGD